MVKGDTVWAAQQKCLRSFFLAQSLPHITLFLKNNLYIFYFWPRRVAFWELDQGSGIEPVTHTMETWSPNYRNSSPSPPSTSFLIDLNQPAFVLSLRTSVGLSRWLLSHDPLHPLGRPNDQMGQGIYWSNVCTRCGCIAKGNQQRAAPSAQPTARSCHRSSRRDLGGSDFQSPDIDSSNITAASSAGS